MENRNFKHYGVDQQRLQIPDIHFDKFPNPQTLSCWKKRLKTVVCTCSKFPLRKRCFGSQSWRWLIRWMIKNLRALFRESLLFLTSSCSTRGLHQPWTRSSRIPSPRRSSVWRNKRLRKQTDSFEEDRSLPWSTTTFVSLASTILYSILPTYSLLFFGMTIFKKSIRDLTKIYCLWNNSHLRKSVQIKNTRVWVIDDRIRILQVGDSSEES